MEGSLTVAQLLRSDWRASQAPASGVAAVGSADVRQAEVGPTARGVVSTHAGDPGPVERRAVVVSDARPEASAVAAYGRVVASGHLTRSEDAEATGLRVVALRLRRARATNRS